VAITGVEITPTSNDSDAATKSFQETPVVAGGTPSATTTAWGVAVEPIASGKIGRLAVGGVVQLKKADLGKAAGACVIWKDDNWALIRMDGGVVRGTFTAPWNKNATATVTIPDSPGATRTAKNYFANISGSGTKNCAIAFANGEWILIATEC
jgi:predicted RecA/RadA family phage recombinase